MSGWKMILILVVSLSSFHMVCSNSLQVDYLPGFPGKLPFKLQTGYIGVGESEEIQLFYYFIESERSPENDPLLLWLQGGPACSGFSGLVFEIGPLLFDYADTESNIPALLLNPYSWTKLSNIIFIDQPLGAGFSYAESPDAYNKQNDTLSATLTYEFLKKWLISHPKYQKNSLYIAGESYCGLVLPLIVDQVYNGIKAGVKPHLNMKGYILGNPITDYFIDFNGRIPYAHKMGLLSDELYLSAKENCNGNYRHIEPNNYLCKNDMEKVNQCLEKIRMDHILEPSCDMDSVNVNHILQSSTLRAKSWCRPMNYLFSYNWANIKLVQQALHVREGTISEWVRCNRTLQNGGYTYNVESTVNYHKKLVDQTECRALIFSGDHDMAAPHSGTEEWIRLLKLQIKSDWRPWFVEGQVAGYTTTYFSNVSELTYATVKGAGHTAPEFKPLECVSMIDRWLNYNTL